MWTIWRIWQWRIQQNADFWDGFFTQFEEFIPCSFQNHVKRIQCCRIVEIIFVSRTHCKIQKNVSVKAWLSLCSKLLNKLNEKDDGQPQFTRDQTQPVFVDKSNVITDGWFADSKAYVRLIRSAIMAQAQTQGPTKGSSTITSLQWDTCDRVNLSKLW